MICVYNLFIWNLTLDDAGTYYCAVTSCGHTMFATGTTIKIPSKTCMFVSVSLTYLSWCNVNVIISLFFSLMRCSCHQITWYQPCFYCIDDFKYYPWDNDSSTGMGTLEESQKRPEKYVKLYFILNALSLYLSSWEAKCHFIVHNAFILYVDISNFHWLSTSLFTVPSESDGSPQNSQVLHECFCIFCPLFILQVLYTKVFLKGSYYSFHTS